MPNGYVPVSELVTIMERYLKFSRHEICRHYVCCDILSLLEREGYPISMSLAGAVVNAEDQAALGLIEKELKNI